MAFIVTALENLRFILWVLCLLIILGCGVTAIAHMNVDNATALMHTLWAMALLLFCPTLVYQLLIKPTYLISLCELHYHHVNGQPAVVPATSNPDTD